MNKLIYIGIILILFTCIALTFPQPKTEWTVITLKEYFESKLDALALAVDEAKEFSKEKFANTNEWRNTLENLGRTYMPRLEQESRDKAQDDRIQANTDAIKKIENIKQGGNIVWAYIIGGAGMFFGMISLLLTYQKKDK